jgi:hypothetical protein
MNHAYAIPAFLAALLLSSANAADHGCEARMAELRKELQSSDARSATWNETEPLVVELAELGDEAAVYVLAEHYVLDVVESLRTPQPARFLSIFTRISNKGIHSAQIWLAYYYEQEAQRAILEGRSPVDAQIAAYQWYLLAQLSGHYGNEKLHELRKSLTDDQVVRAYEQAHKHLRNAEGVGDATVPPRIPDTRPVGPSP